MAETAIFRLVFPALGLSQRTHLQLLRGPSLPAGHCWFAVALPPVLECQGNPVVFFEEQACRYLMF